MRYDGCTWGSCRRQVLWISKQILQLVMEDAIDDWILRQIHLLRRDDVVSKGILWVQDVWIFGTCFLFFPFVMNARFIGTFLNLISYCGRMVHSLQGWRATNPRCNKLRAKGTLAVDNQPRVPANFSSHSWRHPVEQMT